MGSEGTVGLDFYGAAMSVATEYVSSYKPVQMGLSMATILPVASIQRAARAARRAGAKGIEGGVDSSPSIITDAINSVLSYLGFPWSLPWRIHPNHTLSLALSPSPLSKSLER